MRGSIVKRLTSICLAVTFCGVADWANAQVWIEGGTTTCADWVKGRQEHRADILEALVVGLLNGMSMTTNLDF